MNYSILYIPPSGTTQHCQHSWIAHYNNASIGHIHMHIEAEKKIKFLDAWVHEGYRRQGVYRTLWDTRWDFIHKDEKYKGYKVYAWCKPKSLPLLLENGFIQGDDCIYVEKEIMELPPGEQCFVSC